MLWLDLASAVWLTLALTTWFVTTPFALSGWRLAARYALAHKLKRDAPSGTALALGQSVASARGQLQNKLGRSGKELRASDELGYAAARGGDVSGEHTVFFLGQGERIELTHRATVDLPAGTHRVTMAFRPATWRALANTSGA